MVEISSQIIKKLEKLISEVENSFNEKYFRFWQTHKETCNRFLIDLLNLLERKNCLEENMIGLDENDLYYCLVALETVAMNFEKIREKNLIEKMDKNNIDKFNQIITLINEIYLIISKSSNKNIIELM